MKRYVLILTLFLYWSCADVGQIVSEIETHNLMETEYVGLAAHKSEEYNRFQKLKSQASEEELNQLISHKNPIVKTYAFLSLIERDKLRSSDAFEKAMDENESFSRMSGDQILGTSVCTEIYFDLLNETPNSTSEMKIIDSLIIFGIDSTHFLHYVALNDKKHKSTFNERIRHLANQYENNHAKVYLDKHNIEER